MGGRPEKFVVETFLVIRWVRGHGGLALDHKTHSLGADKKDKKPKKYWPVVLEFEEGI